MKPMGPKESQTKALRESKHAGRKTPTAPKSERKKAAEKAVAEVKAKPPKMKKPKLAKRVMKTAPADLGVGTAPAQSKVRPGSKLEAVKNLLLRPEGCTTADVLKVTGWPAVSMPQQAKAAALSLRKEKQEGHPTRYWGSAL